MRKNTPVTKNEVKVKDDDILISKTDLKGIITYASHDFVRLSGFSEEELVGNPHNIVRHPDVPEWVFKDLWETVQAGRPWAGVVKNRCKNGDFYWVYAEVSPIKERGKIVGYMSTRYQATPQQVQEAIQTYKRTSKLTGKEKMRLKLWLSIRQRLYSMVLMTILLLLSVAGLFYYSFRTFESESSKTNQLSYNMNLMEMAFQEELQAWKNILIRAKSPEELTSLSKKHDEKSALVHQQIEKLQKNLKDFSSEQTQDMEKTVESILILHNQIEKDYERALAVYRQNPEQNMEQADNIAREKAGQLDARIRQLSSALRSYTMNRIKEMESFYLLIVLIAIAGGSGLLVFFTVYLSRMLFVPIRDLIQIANRMSEGDLTGEIRIDGNDEMAQLLEAIRMMRINIRGLTSQIMDSSKNNAETAEKLNKNADVLTETAREQVTSMEETSAVVEQLTSAAEHVVEIIHQQTQNVDFNRKNSQSMVESMKSMERGMVDLQELARESTERATMGEATISQAVEAMQEIKTQSTRIVEIINLITDISDQTNLLSLNAAIEAARAGEGGRGFAVVADEISRLADRTGESVKEIDKLVSLTASAVENGSVQFSAAANNFRDIIQRVESIDGSITELQNTVRSMVNKAGEIGQTTDKVTQIAREIENAANEQKRAMSEMNLSMQNISEKGQTVGNNADELNMVVKEMRHHSELMHKIVDQFKVK